MADKRPKRYLRNYLLDARLQLRYVFGVTLFSAGVATALGAVIYRQSRFASEQIIAALDAPEMQWIGEGLRAQVLGHLASSDLELVFSMALGGLVLAGILMGALVVMTHKVAGPLYRMATLFGALRVGRLKPVGKLRKGDQFAQLFEALRGASEAMRRRAVEDVAAIDALLRAYEGIPGERSTELEASLTELEALLQEKRESLASW